MFRRINSYHGVLCWRIPRWLHLNACASYGSRNSDYFPTQHRLIGFYNRDGVCLQRGMERIFKYNSGQLLSLNS